MINNLDNEMIYDVVINEEEQYSIWQTVKIIPLGWRKTGFTGTKAECLKHIKEVWTDMRPLSLKRDMDSKLNMN